jgi:hypothetical protein
MINVGYVSWGDSMPFIRFLAVIGLTLAVVACASPGTSSRGASNSGSAGGGARPSGDLAAAVAGINSARINLEHLSSDSVSELARNVDTLDTAINSGRVTDPNASLVLKYYRGVGREMLILQNKRMGFPVEKSELQAVLNDFEAVANVPDSESVRVLRPEGMYAAAQFLSHFMNDDVRAFTYYGKCAELGHAGCLNVMAFAKMTGDGGQKVDLREAAAIHLQVYKTGTEFGCAGPFSARSLAMIVHFTGVKPTEDDEFEWLHKAYRLMDKMTVGARGAATCGIAGLQVIDYLMRYEGGVRRTDILKNVLSNDTDLSPDDTATLRFLSGDMAEGDFQAEIAKRKVPSQQCELEFIGLWNAAIGKRMDVARAYHASMKSKDSDSTCRYLLVFTRKYFPDGA